MFYSEFIVCYYIYNITYYVIKLYPVNNIVILRCVHLFNQKYKYKDNDKNVITYFIFIHYRYCYLFLK